MTSDSLQFTLRLPHGGPIARGTLLDERGANKQRRFVVFKGSPARAESKSSLGERSPAGLELRERLMAAGVLVPSSRWPNYLELTQDYVFSSPRQATQLLYGRPVSRVWAKWKTEDGRLLTAFMTAQDGSSGSDGAWLVRGDRIAGHDLVQELWLADRLVSLPATRLRVAGVEQGMSKELLTTYVEQDYESSATYSERQELVADFHAFLTRMKPGDLVSTLSRGQLFLGEIAGDLERVVSERGWSDLRRQVDWRPTGLDATELPAEIQQRLSIQHDVVDLAKVRDLLSTLGMSDEELAEDEDDDPTGTSLTLLRQELRLPDPDRQIADELLIDRDWLQEVRDLLWDDKQIVLYGPPGTGKTYLAQHLAEFLGGGPEQVKLVQFHPSYSYEDFFEGFRPRQDNKTGEVAFRLTAGPLRELADLASREGKRHIPHFLIIDELNRANLAKVFGELYFLLEYRNRSVRLTYSADDFALPPNLFIIGTMNTADRSIALVDAAMRRRFAFIELSPRTEPTKGLLHRWLKREGKDPEPALLLDALNARIPADDFKIGPSYLMKPGVYRAGGLERTWRTKILPLLEEHHYGEDVPIEQRYGIAALRRSLDVSPPIAVPSPAQSLTPPFEQSSGLTTDGDRGFVSAPPTPAITSQRPLFGPYAPIIEDDTESHIDYGPDADSRAGQH